MILNTRELAKKIADTLFTPGEPSEKRKKAEFLKLYRGEKYLCGWGEKPAMDAIHIVIERWLKGEEL